MQIAPTDNHAARLAGLRALLTSRGLDALVVTSLPNIAYLTGFFASAGALVVSGEALLLIGDGRYGTVLQERAAAWPAITPVLVDTSSSYDESLVAVVRGLSGRRVAFEAAHL